MSEEKRSLYSYIDEVIDCMEGEFTTSKVYKCFVRKYPKIKNIRLKAHISREMFLKSGLSLILMGKKGRENLYRRR